MKKYKKKTAKLSDVARMADVAISTVSRVVNDSHLVSSELRERVEKAIVELGYQPIPRDRRKGVRKDPFPHLKSKVIKIVIYGPFDSIWITNYAPIFSYALHGIESRLGAFNLRRVVERAEGPEDLEKVLKAGGADGFLVLNTGYEAIPDFVSGYPVVLFMGSHNTVPCDRVVPDGHQAGVMAADFLRSKGCRFCVAYGGSQEVYVERASLFSLRLEPHGIEVRQLLLAEIIRSETMHRANRTAISSKLGPLLKKAKRPIGIFSLMDMLTPAIYTELQSLNLKIGKDVFIVSCNNERPYLDALSPPPSAILDTCADYIGRRAVDQLMRRIEFPSTPFEQVRVAASILTND